VNPLDGLMKQYTGQTGFYFMEMKTHMFGLANDDAGSNSTGQSISINVLSFREEENSAVKAGDIYNQFKSGIDVDSYKGLAELKSSGDKVEMMIRKKGQGEISDIIIIINEKDEAIILSATGTFNLNDISRLSKMKNCHGLEILNQLCQEE
jgi:hypothetical protein